MSTICNDIREREIAMFCATQKRQENQFTRNPKLEAAFACISTMQVKERKKKTATATMKNTTAIHMQKLIAMA